MNLVATTARSRFAASAANSLPMMRCSNLAFLAAELVLKDFRVRYRNMSLGVFWSLLNPLTMMVLLSFVFTHVFQNRIPYYPLYVLCGLIPYNFFTLSWVTATLSISENPALVKRVPMPTALLPLVSVLGMVFLWHTRPDAANMAAHAEATFWFVLPSLPMFLLIPALLRAGVNFWIALLAGCALTVALYLAMVTVGPRFGLRL